MRFESGVDIPEEVLLALDEGRVVFFCGAGVSHAKAHLPNFSGLAEMVFKRLRVLPGNPAAKVYCNALKIKKITGVQGLITADRIFGFLENDFLKRDVERAVAQSLKPKKDVDLSVHEILLDLATTISNQTKLVTTNFDRLFDDCGRDLKIWQPPRLPDPSRLDELDGIVYLHGRANRTYDGSESDGFVLSISDFGRAYLTESWATRFVKEIMARYVVVFIGYSADDPPVQYLLEALAKTPEKFQDVFAFQSGNQDQARNRWKPKGVTAIAYSDRDKHKALWETLAEWAKRVKDPIVWQNSVVDMAQEGPEKLSPIQREQVAHFVSTKIGARKFFECKEPLPATWLRVFDRTLRLNTQYSDRFHLYGLASDPAPKQNCPHNELYPPPEVPDNAWDAFQPNRHDLAELTDKNIAPLRGKDALNAGHLPSRLDYLGGWIAKVSDQKVTVDWAARQEGLHPNIQSKITDTNSKSDPDILRIWHYLFEHWNSKNDSDQLGWYKFNSQLRREGWSKYAIRKFEELSRPYMSVSPKYVLESHNDNDVDLDVVIGDEQPEIKVPNQLLGDMLAACRRNLDVGIQLKTECQQYRYFPIPTIVNSDDPEFRWSDGLERAILCYAELFKRLIKEDYKKARQEAAMWPVDNDNVYARLRIWACRFKDLVPDEQFGEFFANVSRAPFWEKSHQCDLLSSLKERWAELPQSARDDIEARILEGCMQHENEPDDQYVKHKARKIADRIYWLKDNGCALDLDYDQTIKQLKADAPEWTPEYAEAADRFMEPRCEMVRTETDPTELLGEPISTILTKAQELKDSNTDFFVRHDPFNGLCENHPVKSLSALRHEAKKGKFPPWAWHTFLTKRENNSGRMKNFMAAFLSTIPSEGIKDILSAVTDWFLTASKDIPEQSVPVFERLAGHLIDFLRDNPEVSELDIEQGAHSINWVNKALNSPSGKIAQALFNDSRIKKLEPSHGLPKCWLTLVKSMINLGGDAGRLALVFFVYNLNWFHLRDSKWTDKSLISILSAGDQNTVDAWWAAYFWSAHSPKSFELFQQLKPYLLEKASGKVDNVGKDLDILCSLVLDNWGYSEPETGAVRISDEEFHKVLVNSSDDFRSTVLRMLQSWCHPEKAASKEWKELHLRFLKLRLPFLKNVWPIHLIAKTDINSVILIHLAFFDEKTFLEVSEAILPLLCPMKDNPQGLPLLPIYGVVDDIVDDIVDNIFKSHTERVLEILWAILPEDTIKWPYKAAEILERIKNAKPELQRDKRFIELNRRWNKR